MFKHLSTYLNLPLRAWKFNSTVYIPTISIQCNTIERKSLVAHFLYLFKVYLYSALIIIVLFIHKTSNEFIQHAWVRSNLKIYRKSNYLDKYVAEFRRKKVSP